VAMYLLKATFCEILFAADTKAHMCGLLGVDPGTFARCKCRETTSYFADILINFTRTRSYKNPSALNGCSKVVCV
jgi:hypothetical protein